MEKPKDLVIGDTLSAAIVDNPIANDDDFIIIHRLNWTADEAATLRHWLTKAELYLLEIKNEKKV